MVEQISGYEIGALMYCPAGSRKTIADALLREQYPKPFSLAFCLEDTIPDSAVEEAEQDLLEILRQISAYAAQKCFYLPLIFIRVRSPEQLRKLANLYSPFSSVLRGFILPKFFVENSLDYIQAIQEISRTQPEFGYMPIFESPAMIDLHTRYESLAQIRCQLDTVSDKILCVRVGGNDLCHAFGLRRGVGNTIYDIRPVANLLADLVATFVPRYVVSGPVWEYFGGDGWEEGLRKELSLDMLNGFIGKTVIHPNQISVVNDMLKVTIQDYEDARRIIRWQQDEDLLVSSSADATRMNEYKTHFNWANKTLRLAQIYGIREV